MSSVEWPEGLPRTYDELAAKYGDYIVKRVRKYNQVDRNFEDLFQSIWMKLIESNLLNKFAARAASTLPPTMTAEEACSYLGITFEAWQAAVRPSTRMPVPIGGISFRRGAVVRTEDIARFDKSGYIRKRHYPQCCDAEYFGETMTAEEACAFWGVNFSFWKNLMTAARKEARGNFRLSKLVSGKLSSPKARVLTKDVEALDASGVLGVRTESRRRPEPTARGFKTYLGNAIHNHFANFCRTQNRRNKDEVLAPQTIIIASTSGYYYAGKSEEGTAWEGALVEAMVSPEEIVDVVSGIRRARLNPNSKRGVEVLDYMADGYTISEALKLRHKARSKARLRARTA